ncbi:hypothetical protein KNE206_07580 [Kitasatospora sp. NE20-6]|uniref:WD40 repeat domain-containing protein n=1 Tax=Kitasatospora sp. NE20-6 TaxID=2859066 RepID=UPI0034DBC63F
MAWFGGKKERRALEEAWGGGAAGRALAGLRPQAQVTLITALPPETDLLADTLAEEWRAADHGWALLDHLKALEAEGLVRATEPLDGTRRVTVPQELHDLIASRTPEAETRAWHGRLLDTARGLLPPGGSWWDLPPHADHWWRHLPWHLLRSDGEEATAALVGDPRWQVAKLLRSGPDALAADLDLVAAPAVVLARQVVEEHADRLDRLDCEDPDERAERLLAALAEVGQLRPQAEACRSERQAAALRRAPVDASTALVASFPLTPRSDGFALAPDGSWLASVAWDGHLRILDVDDGSVRRIGPLEGLTNRCAVLGDGSAAVTGEHGLLHVWHPVDGSLLSSVALTGMLGLPTDPEDFASSPDGRHLVVTGTVGTVDLAAPYTGRTAAFPLPDGPRPRVTATAITPDGSALALGDEDGGVTLRTFGGAELLGEIPAHGRRVVRIAVGPGTAWLAVTDTERTRVLAFPDGRELLTLDTRYPVAVCGGGRWLAVAGAPSVRIHDTADWALLGAFPAGREDVIRLAVTPDGHHLATQDRRGPIRVWDTRRLVR